MGAVDSDWWVWDRVLESFCVRPMSRGWFARSTTVAMVVASLVMALPSFAGGSDAQETTVRVEPASGNRAAIGDELRVDVVVDGVLNLGGFQLSVEFDPDVLKAKAVEQQGLFLGISGRKPFCPEPEIAPGSVKLLCATLGPPASLGGKPGADGTGILTTIVFTATGRGESALVLRDLRLVQAEIGEGGDPILILAVAEDGMVAVTARHGFAWTLWGPVIGAGALLVAVLGVAGWRRLAGGQ